MDDVIDSWKRIEIYSNANRSTLDAAVGDKSFMSKIGFYPIWRKFVIDVIFPEDGALYDRFLTARGTSSRRRR